MEEEKMKAKVINHKIRNSVTEAIRRPSGGRTVTRLVIESLNNLAITPDGENLYVGEGRRIDGTLIAEVDVPDELVEKAQAFLHAKNEFEGLRPLFKELIPKTMKGGPFVTETGEIPLGDPAEALCEVREQGEKQIRTIQETS